MGEQVQSATSASDVVLTETLPEGTFFVGPDGVLYQVVMAEGAGFRKAEPWPWSEPKRRNEPSQAVALVPGSLLARNYPVVARGTPLPTYNRTDFLGPDRKPSHYIFTTEPLAKLASQLDAALSPQSGLTAHKESQRWLLTDGHHNFREYHYESDIKGEPVDLHLRFENERIKARPCDEGPRYWQHLPGWKKPAPPAAAETPLAGPVAPVEAAAAPAPVESAPLEPPAQKIESAPSGPPPPPPRPIPSPPLKPVVPIEEAQKPIERRFDFRSLFGILSRNRADKPIEVPVAPPVDRLAQSKPEQRSEVNAPAGPIAPPAAPEAPTTTPPPAVEPPVAPIGAPEPPAVATATTVEPPPAPKPRRPRRTLMMVLSIDIGYGYTKGVGADTVRFSFPSVIGTAEDIRFATNLISGDAESTITYGDWQFFYGEQALLQSRIQSTIFDRSRIHDQIYKMLFVAALVEMAKQAPDIERVRVITGLPVEFFNDRTDVVQLFEGAYQITTDRAIKCLVESVYVAPQPFGSLFRELLNDQGKIVSDEIEKGRIGVIDVGTYTTDFIVADELRYVQRLGGSLRIGWSKVISKVQQSLSDLYRLDLTPHQVDHAMLNGQVRVRGELTPLAPLMEPAVNEVQAAIIARARDLWGEGTSLDAILVTGGGASQLYNAILEAYPHARLLDNAFWANAEGFQRFGRRPATFKE